MSLYRKQQNESYTRPYTRLTKVQLAELEGYFAIDQHPDKICREFIAQKLNMNTNKVSCWFVNARAKWRCILRATSHYYSSTVERWEKRNTFPHATWSSQAGPYLFDIKRTCYIDSDSSSARFIKEPVNFHCQNATSDRTVDTSMSLVREMQIQLTPYKPIFRPYLL